MANAIDTTANVKGLISSFINVAKYLDQKETDRAEHWRTLAPFQFDGVEIADGVELTSGPLLDAGLAIAEKLKDHGKKNAALSLYRNELQRALCDFKGWDRKEPLFTVGLKQATKKNPARLVFKAVGGNKQTAVEALAGLIKVYGIDEVTAAIMGHADLLTAVNAEIELL